MYVEDMDLDELVDLKDEVEARIRGASETDAQDQALEDLSDIVARIAELDPESMDDVA